ncbi:TorF family putative porin [Sphingomonas sp.]|uniref:TorF family putative porin n=1 Tax=Sphingomonas sp. TaxID=28214 RepID=UPI0035BBA73E
MRFTTLLLAGTMLAAAAPAFAQDETAPPKAVTVTGSVAIVSDYRFRGVSQSDEQLAVQGGFTIAHKSGFYVGTWGSNLAGWGTFGGANMELDLIAGFKTPIGGGGTLDVGATWYMYPGGFDNTDFIEPYAKLSGTTGPLNLTAGVAYAPKQQALGPWYRNGTSAANGVYDRVNAKDDNLYVWGDAAAGVPNTGLTVKGHIGYSNGNKGLGPFATSVSPTGEYFDWLAGADYTIPSTPLTLGVAYIDTDISKRESAYLQPSFSKGQDGTGSIADATVLVSLTAAF